MADNMRREQGIALLSILIALVVGAYLVTMAVKAGRSALHSSKLDALAESIESIGADILASNDGAMDYSFIPGDGRWVMQNNYAPDDWRWSSELGGSFQTDLWPVTINHNIPVAALPPGDPAATNPNAAVAITVHNVPAGDALALAKRLQKTFPIIGDDSGAWSINGLFVKSQQEVIEGGPYSLSFIVL